MSDPNLPPGVSQDDIDRYWNGCRTPKQAARAEKIAEMHAQISELFAARMAELKEIRRRFAQFQGDWTKFEKSIAIAGAEIGDAFVQVWEHISLDPINESLSHIEDHLESIVTDGEHPKEEDIIEEVIRSNPQ